LSRATYALAALAAVLVAAGVWLAIAVRRESAPPAAPGSGSVVAADRPAPGEGARAYVPAPAPVRDAGPVAPTMPTVDALAQAPATREQARVERATLLETMHQSGDASEAWAPRATQLIGAIGKYAAATTPEGCFVAGCAATFAFASRADFDHAMAEVSASADYQAWTGGKRWTAPELAPDGRVLVALLLYRPD